jgi:indole-3-glycerol phosphate synthase
MILDTIVARKKEEVKILRTKGTQLPAEFLDREIEPPRGFRESLLKSTGVAIIAEVKKASPSKGVICPDFTPVDIAKNYEQCGAQAISVLTDVDFFQGHLRYLMQVRDTIKLPVLRKDFIIDELQVQEAQQHGADAILLIAAILDYHQLEDLQVSAQEKGMDVLVEVHDEPELEKVLRTTCNLIGINNRNLKDFSMDIETTFKLKGLIPKEIAVVSESGLKTREDIVRLQNSGIAAALIGETLMRAGEKSNFLQELTGGLS